MLRRIKILLEPVREEKYHYNMSSLFHGLLMDMLDREYAGRLHESGLKPFSQFLSAAEGGKSWLWVVNTLTGEAGREIGEKILQEDAVKFYLKDKSLELQVREKMADTPVSYRELTRRFYLKQAPQRVVKIRFLTPCSFKTANQYAIFPDVSLIYQSLMNKYDAFADDFSLKSGEALEHLTRHTRIKNYRLKSAAYSLEGVKIPSFMGEADLAVSGPETMLSLANLLFRFGEWSGIGIKTALGMGAVSIE